MELKKRNKWKSDVPLKKLGPRTRNYDNSFSIVFRVPTSMFLLLSPIESACRSIARPYMSPILMLPIRKSAKEIFRSRDSV